MTNEFFASMAAVSVAPFAVTVTAHAVAEWPTAKWRALRWASNRAFRLARALNRAKNDAHWDACN